MALELADMDFELKNQISKNSDLVSQDKSFGGLFGKESPVRKLKEEYNTPVMKQRDLTYLLDSA